jgi:hypothetical protein
MNFPTHDGFVPLQPPAKPNYDSNNPLLRVAREVERVEFAAERDHYLADSLQFLFPYRDLSLYGPSDGDWNKPLVADQNNKNDFQKQNIQSFTLSDFHLARGYACAGDWVGSFLKICYRATPGTVLGRLTGGEPGPHLNAWVKVGNAMSSPYVRLPLNPATGCYETELWAYAGSNLRELLSEKGRAALDAGLIQPRPDLVKGSLADWQGPAVDQERDALNRSFAPLQLFDRAPDHTLHPLRPLRVELAFANHDTAQWDSQNGANYRVEFDMLLRGWRNYLAVGVSPNPHGGVGFLEYRNLLSNYFGYEAGRRAALGVRWKNELGRDLIPGNFDAHTWRPAEPDPVGPKVVSPKRESFFAVDYMDLHVLQPECAIGIHRHRDNQEVFLLLQGKGLMLVGDWAQFPDRDRAFELRTLLPGDLAICKTGQLHALFNPTDEICLLFMFGGYD